MGAPRAIALCRCFDGALEFQAGNWEAAEAALRESVQMHRDIGAASGEALACQRLGVLLTEQGRLEEGKVILEEGLIAASGPSLAEWRFSAVALRRVRRMHAIERDFDAVPELAALVADMLEEMDALRARLQRSGLP